MKTILLAILVVIITLSTSPANADQYKTIQHSENITIEFIYNQNPDCKIIEVYTIYKYGSTTLRKYRVITNRVIEIEGNFYTVSISDNFMTVQKM